MDSSELRRRSARGLTEMAVAEGIEAPGALRRADLVVALLNAASRRGEELTGDGVLEITPDGFGFLRSPQLSYLPGTDDVYVSPSQIRRFDLRTGDTVGGVIRPPKEGERYVALLKVAAINQRSPDARRPAVDFTDLEVAPPTRWLELGPVAPAPPASLLVGAIDLLAPLPAGGRVLVLGPSGSGRTTLLLSMADALAARHPDLAVHLVLLDQPREDLIELAPAPEVELAATALDEPPARHIQVADLALARAERLAEGGRDVVLLIDSLSRLSGAQHAAQPRTSGALDPTVLQRTRRLLAAGRALAAGGSLTIIASARTGSTPLDVVAVDELGSAASSIVRLAPAATRAGLSLDVGATTARRTDRYLTAAHHADVERLRAELVARAPADAARRLAELVAERAARGEGGAGDAAAGPPG